MLRRVCRLAEFVVTQDGAAPTFKLGDHRNPQAVSWNMRRLTEKLRAEISAPCLSVTQCSVVSSCASRCRFAPREKMSKLVLTNFSGLEIREIVQAAQAGLVVEAGTKWRSGGAERDGWAETGQMGMKAVNVTITRVTSFVPVRYRSPVGYCSLPASNGSSNSASWAAPYHRGYGRALPAGVPKTLGLNVALSKLVAAEIALLNNFTWNELCTFRDRRRTGILPVPPSGRPGDPAPAGTWSPSWLSSPRTPPLLLVQCHLRNWNSFAIALLELFHTRFGWNLYLSNLLTIGVVTLWNFGMDAVSSIGSYLAVGRESKQNVNG